MSTHECLVAFFISNINWEADIPWLLWPFLTILFVIPTMFLFSACRICLFLHIITSSIFSLVPVFSQLPILPFLGQNLLSSNQSSTCFFFCVLFWLPVAFTDLVSHREREETSWHSQKHHCLCLLHRGKRRDTPPLMPSTVALPLLAPPLPPSAT